MAATETAPSGGRSRPWVFWARIVVSAGLLAVLVSRINFNNLVPEHPHLATLAFLALGLVVTLGGFVLSAWRWQRVLFVFDAPVRVRVLLSHYLAGQFVGNVLPSTIGGDVLRVSRASNSTDSSSVAFASVALERLSGFVALPLLSLVGFVAMPSLLDGSTARASHLALIVDGVSLAALVAILLLAGSPRLAGRFREHENWMRFVGAVHLGVDRLRRHPRLALGVLGAAVLYQLSTVLVVWCAIHVLDLEVPNATVLAFVPAVAMVQVLPISLSGLGIREGALVLFLHHWVHSGQAVAVGLLWYAMLLVVSLLGAPSFAIGHRVGVGQAAKSSAKSGDGEESTE
jgi:uncharacterized membrane protein YbhN (UPF0104 family)